MQNIIISLPFKICRIILNFHQNRSFKVKVGSAVSKEYSMIVGCEQGSTLGPRLFSIYCGGLRNIIKDELVACTDDVYVLIPGTDVEELKEKAISTIVKHVEWLEIYWHGS